MITGKGNRAAQRKRYRLKHPDKIKAAKKRYREKHPEKVLAEKKRYRENHPEKIKEYRDKYNKEHPEKGQGYMKRLGRSWKLKAISHYSNGLLKCAACGEGHIEFLEIDHINGGGNKHKREIGNKGKMFYKWLIDQGFPAGYQVLCSNCNIKKVKEASRIRGTTGTAEQKKYYSRLLKIRMDIFSHYMIDGKIKCACPGCKVTDPDLLCIDHINGDGAEHRRVLSIDKNPKGFFMYRWIQKNNYPPDFRLLCHNCNSCLGHRGFCPHNKNFSIFKI